MLSRTPTAIVFYQDTKLLNLFIDLRTPEIGHDFTINNTCNSDKSHFLGQLLAEVISTLLYGQVTNDPVPLALFVTLCEERIYGYSVILLSLVKI